MLLNSPSLVIVMSSSVTLAVGLISLNYHELKAIETCHSVFKGNDVCVNLYHYLPAGVCVCVCVWVWVGVREGRWSQVCMLCVCVGVCVCERG